MLKRKTDYRLEELAQALYELAEQSYPNGSPWQVGQFLADLQNEWSQYLIFTLEDDRLAGFVGFHQLFDEIEIMHVVVTPDKKGQGIGQE
ncbi:MAG: GNAT family N-acetyltransferase, partial [Enterococcus aquimarinus]